MIKFDKTSITFIYQYKIEIPTYTLFFISVCYNNIYVESIYYISIIIRNKNLVVENAVLFLAPSYLSTSFKINKMLITNHHVLMDCDT